MIKNINIKSDKHYVNLLTNAVSNIPLTIFIGENDTLIPKNESLDFSKGYRCEFIYVDDSHCLANEKSWQTVVTF